MRDSGVRIELVDGTARDGPNCIILVSQGQAQANHELLQHGRSTYRGPALAPEIEHDTSPLDRARYGLPCCVNIRLTTRSGAGLMKISVSVACLIIIVAVVGCTTEIPVTVEVTREVETTREVEVTRIVEVTREAPGGLDLDDLCSDYEYIVELGDRQLDYMTVAIEAAKKSLPQGDAALEYGETRLEEVGWQVRTARHNSATICGPLSVSEAALPLYEMRTLEGWGVCMETLRVFNQVYGEPWEQLGQELEDAMFALLDGYAQYCDNDYLE